ncbi:ABC transporter substrate-binding protein [Pseudonocardia phyllosphaerae]|uniref:ABC transporter substrate-binding protein n=1 Tax=Pseudonocardia phyllosphaerae TaxID=3390502 RepID=UPI003978191B
MNRLTSTAALLLTGATVVTALTACGGPPDPAAAPEGATVTVRDCGQDTPFPSPARRMFVNDGNMISMVLAIGAQQQVAAVSSLQRDADVLRRHYGAPAVDALNQVAPAAPALETVLANDPDVMVAGWSYGYKEATGVTPERLRGEGIAPYVLTESCRHPDGKGRGTVDPWEALRTDLRNLGTITGRTADADRVVADIDARLAALRAAPQAPTPPPVFLFDSGTDTPYSSGRFGGPQAVLSAASAGNVLSDVDDTWTKVSWERVTRAQPEAIVFVDYPPQTFAQKVALLRSRPDTRDLPAVKANRFLNLPYAMWTSGPLNIDAAEQVRKALEGWKLVPGSGITPRTDDVPQG